MTYGDLARPDLPKPKCRVKLICGPPASGKSMYVKAHAAAADIVIDFDAIALEYGFGRDRPSNVVGELLEERNRRLAALADEPPDRVAWIILSAPSRCLRQWWCEMLGVRDEDLLVLIPTRNELRRRIMSDPERKRTQQRYLELIDKWLRQERADSPGVFKSGTDLEGYPTDPLHPWNRNPPAHIARFFSKHG
jgi:hypothetical protein